MEPREYTTEQPFAWPQVRAVGRDAPRRWLGKALADLRAAPAASLFYGAVLALMGFVLTRCYAGAVGLALITGFLLVGPFLVIGLDDISRRHERGESPQLAPTLVAWRCWCSPPRRCRCRCCSTAATWTLSRP